MTILRRGWLSGGLLAIMILSACSSAPTTMKPPSSYEVNATPPPGLSGPALETWRIWHTVRPLRDQLALAMRLKHIPAPLPQVARTTPLNAKVGDTTTFWVPSDDGVGQQITAQLVYLTPHVYDYVEINTTVDQSALRSSADLFENSVYVTDRHILGSEWTPGVDGDAHITLLNGPDIGGQRLALFNPQDEYVTQIYPHSNQREMLYLRVAPDALTPNTDPYNEALARTFAEMIQWHVRPNDPAWLQGGMAMIAQHINGFDASGADTAFFADPSTPLMEWCDAACDLNAYGAGFLFLDYFSEHYGGRAVLQELLNDPAQAPLNFNDVLAAHGYSDRFDDVFAKWTLANALNDEPQSDSSPFVYKTVTNEHATPQHQVTTAPYSDQGAVAQYATQYYDVAIKPATDQTLRIAFTGQTSVPVIAAPAAPNGAASFWWSNRGATMDSTLTRTIDLTHVAANAAKLQFDLWYDLQANVDYGYISVSVDGGKTWTPQTLAGIASAGVTADNLGAGITGQSGGWKSVTLDLARYAGSPAQVRFETVTGGGHTGQGMAFANIRLPAAQVSDDPAQDSAWNAQGWLRISNAIPENFRVQVALFTSDGSLQAVQPVALASDDSGTLDIPHFTTKVTRALIAVSALAPATTQTAAYTVKLTTGT